MKEEAPTPWHDQCLLIYLPYFLGVAAGAGGAGVAAGAAGAGASAGFTSSLAAGFSGALGLHAIPMAAKLITKTSASKRKIHFFI